MGIKENAFNREKVTLSHTHRNKQKPNLKHKSQKDHCSSLIKRIMIRKCKFNAYCTVITLLNPQLPTD